MLWVDLMYIICVRFAWVYALDTKNFRYIVSRKPQSDLSLSHRGTIKQSNSITKTLTTTIATMSSPPDNDDRVLRCGDRINDMKLSHMADSEVVCAGSQVFLRQRVLMLSGGRARLRGPQKPIRPPPPPDNDDKSARRRRRSKAV